MAVLTEKEFTNYFRDFKNIWMDSKFWNDLDSGVGYASELIYILFSYFVAL